MHSHLFTKEWMEGNFVIPTDRGLRIELKRQLETHVHSGKLHLPESATSRILLQARLAAVVAYDTLASRIPRTDE